MESGKIPNKVIPTIPVQEWEKICTESDSANKLLVATDFEFLRDYLKKAKESIILLFATNSIKDVVETNTDSTTGYSKSVKTTKEEQMNEMAGVIKFIDKFFNDLKELSEQKGKYLELSNKKEINIEVDKEDEK